MIRLLVFDFDGTLFDTREDIAAAVNYTRRWFGLPDLSLDAVTSMVGYGVKTLTERAFSGTQVDPGQALAVLMQYYNTHPGEKARLYPGVAETLPRLDAIRTVVSNKPETLVRRMLAEHGLQDLFDFLAGGDTFPRLKPDPQAIHFLQDRYRLGPREILVVGDHAPDIEMARAAGTWSAFCRYGFFKEDPVGADFQLDSFDQLPAVLRAISEVVGSPNPAAP
jgi:phosphoglycolate phosphatase